MTDVLSLTKGDEVAGRAIGCGALDLAGLVPEAIVGAGILQMLEGRAPFDH